MAQHDYNIANQGFPAFRTDLNNALSAIQTTNSGTSRPTGAVAGQLWLDTTSATTPTLKYYDGADDISLATIDHSANTVNWLDSTVSVTGLTTTATGTVLTLSDSATTSTVNLIIDNDKEIRFREATANGTNYISLSAPASLSADVTYTLPVAPTANNQALISSTAGAMSFTPYSLPATDGTANQILKTNGSGVLSFATPSGGGFSGATTTSSAVDITLTNTSTQVQNVTMTAVDKSVILPDATTLTTKGFPLFVIVNNGLFNFYIKNSNGFIIAIATANTSTEFTLIDNSTSSGIFATDGNAINLGLSDITTIKSGTTGVSTTQAHANPYNIGISADKLSSTSAIIFYVAGTSNRDVYGVVVSYSGTTITVNSETLLYSGSSTAATCFTSVVLDSTTGLIIVGRTSNKIAVPFTISGTTITAGTASATFGTGTGSAGGFSKPVAVSSTLACLFDNTVTDGLIFKLRTIQHNGASAPTIGTASTGTITVNFDEWTPLLSPISATKVFIAYSNNGAPLYTIARIGTLSGTSAPTLETANTSQAQDNNYDRTTGVIKQVSSTEFLYLGSLGTDRYTVSGTTVTYDATSLYGTANSLLPNYYSYQNMVFGDYAIKSLYDNPKIYLLQKTGNSYYIKQSYLSANELYSYNAGGGSFLPIELDSTTVLAVSNNGTTGSKVSAYLIKYIGA
jgi:hypothetical protein